MRSLLSIVLLLISTLISYSQAPPVKYQSGADAEDNLNRIINISPTVTGGMGFDTRFEGVKGSPRLFEKLLPSFVKIDGQNEYFKLNADLDIYQNRLMFNHPKSGKLLSLPANFISEVIIKTDSIENVYKTTASLKFEKKIKDVKFYQILKGGSYQLIKMPIKVLIEADYKKVYGVDKRFDEFETSFKYFIMTSDSIFHPLQLNKKSLTKLFPDKKSLIESAAAGITNKNDEEKILYILSKF